MVKRIIYKKIVDGDLRKFTATSNNTPSGGGARDLRFSPAKEFLEEFKLMFPNENSGILKGKLYWEKHLPTQIEIHSPTNSRSNEVRIGKINECFPASEVPKNCKDCILILVQDDDKVWPYFTSEYSLKNDNWHPLVKKGILDGLMAKRKGNSTPMGYIDVEKGRSYTNGQ